MSGSNAMCVATVLLETGPVPMVEPVTSLVLEAPGGLVTATVSCRGALIRSIAVSTVPSFVAMLDALLEVEGSGTLDGVIAYSGDSFVLADACRLGFSIEPEEACDMSQAGVRITRAANEQLGFKHPSMFDRSHVTFCQIAAPVEWVDGVRHGRHAVEILPCRIDHRPAPVVRRAWLLCTREAE